MFDELRIRIVMFLVWKYMIVQYETNVQWGVDHEKKRLITQHQVSIAEGYKTKNRDYKFIRYPLVDDF